MRRARARTRTLLIGFMAAFPLLLLSGLVCQSAETRAPCTEDAIIVFDASGSTASSIMAVVNELNAAGKTPLAEAVEQAADVLSFRTKPGVVVLLTDGEETCGRDPRALGKRLKAEAAGLTVHVIGFQMKNFIWMGASSILDVKCLAEETGGLYIPAENEEDLVRAFKQTLSCPLVSAMG